VLAVDENHPIARSALAYVYGMQRKYEQALEQAQQAIESNPGRAMQPSEIPRILKISLLG
jgi:tetratricopeptide (TPR) repeat protein